jgi:hypothetical protein
MNFTNNIIMGMNSSAFVKNYGIKIFVIFALFTVLVMPVQAIGISIGQKYAGGIVIYVDDTDHGLVVAPHDLPKLYRFPAAKEACKALVLNGYSDWFLPDQSQLEMLYQQKAVIGGFTDDWYWSSTTDLGSFSMVINFEDGYITKDDWISKRKVRPIRAF